MDIFTFKNYKTAENVMTVAYSMALILGVIAIVMIVFGF
jgi:hypothetical protein